VLFQTKSSLVRIEEPNAIAAKLVNEPFRQYAEATIPPSKNRLKSYPLKDWDSQPLAESLECITKLSPFGFVKAARQLPVDNPRRRIVPLLRSMNSAALSLKKSKCWIWVAMDSTVGKVLGLVCGSRSIKTARELFKLLKDLPTMGYGTDFLKTYGQLIPTALHHQCKTFATQIESLNRRFRHYLARLHRRTLCYSKSKRMLEISLKLLIHKLNNP